MNWKIVIAATALGALVGAAQAQPHMHPRPTLEGYEVGPGYGMANRYGPGPMHGYGMPGPGMGRWGDGMGAGMMGGFGPLGLGPVHRLSGLDDSQRQQLRKIEDDLRRGNWELMGRMQDEMAKQRDAWAASKTDRDAILAAHKRMFELRQQMLVNRLDAQDKAEALLTPPQREQLDKWTRSWSRDDN